VRTLSKFIFVLQKQAWAIELKQIIYALFNDVDGSSDFRDVCDRKKVVLKYWIACGKKGLLPLLRYHPIFAWKDRRKRRKKTGENIPRSVFVVIHGHLPHTSPKCYNLHQLVLKIAKCNWLIVKRHTDWPPYKDTYFTLCLRR